MKNKYDRAIVLIRYLIMMVLFKSENQIANSCRGRLAQKANKTLTHTAIVVNKLQTLGDVQNQQLEQIAKIVQWLMLTQSAKINGD